MARLIELVGLLAPVAGIALLLVHRRRSRAAFAWGMLGCLLGLIASGIGLGQLRWSLLAAVRADSGTAGVMDSLETWTLLRFGLMLLAGAILVIASLVDRRGRRPTGWIIGGAAVMAAGIGLQLVGVELGAEHERLVRILLVLREIVQAGLLGAGFLVLCAAAVSHRPGAGGRREPTDQLRSAGAAAWRFYRESRR
ncbi:hypothetical protein [Brachybacterium massiliense]|uniref:hypothetical protein n=1 Tax=Brachybacterium massiliense TaxID=1755098 RepID=UPI000B3BB0D3|nr:hypothetical protein [Brachybacterium massiliense]